MTARAQRREPRARLRAARILAAFLSLVAAIPYFGLIDLATLVGWVNPEFQWPVPLDVSWGALFTFFFSAGYAWVAILPRRPLPGLVALVIGGGSLLVATAAGRDVRPLPVAVAVLVSVAVLAVLTRPRVTGGVRGIHWPFLVLALLGGALWLPYTLSALAQSGPGTNTEITNGIDPWPVQGAVGIAILVAAVGMAVWQPGRTLLRIAVILSGGIIGVAALAYPNRDGATEGSLWAIVAVLWVLAIAVVPQALPARRSSRAFTTTTDATERPPQPASR